MRLTVVEYGANKAKASLTRSLRSLERTENTEIN